MFNKIIFFIFLIMCSNICYADDCNSSLSNASQEAATSQMSIEFRTLNLIQETPMVDGDNTIRLGLPPFLGLEFRPRFCFSLSYETLGQINVDAFDIIYLKDEVMIQDGFFMMFQEPSWGNNHC